MNAAYLAWGVDILQHLKDCGCGTTQLSDSKWDTQHNFNKAKVLKKMIALVPPHEMLAKATPSAAAAAATYGAPLAPPTAALPPTPTAALPPTPAAAAQPATPPKKLRKEGGKT